MQSRSRSMLPCSMLQMPAEVYTSWVCVYVSVFSWFILQSCLHLFVFVILNPTLSHIFFNVNIFKLKYSFCKVKCTDLPHPVGWVGTCITGNPHLCNDRDHFHLPCHVLSQSTPLLPRQPLFRSTSS